MKTSGHFAEIAARAEKEYPSLERLYRHLHAHPELSRQEEKTSERMARELARARFDAATGVGGFGVVGVLRNGPGPTVMIRADMDALPVAEKTGLPYASRKTAVDAEGRRVGVMHACGHDAHMTAFIGAARVLRAMRRHWRGTLLFVAQPDEEGISGARAMLEDGLFTRFPRPDCALALHVASDLAAGRIGYTKGRAMSCARGLDVTVRGVGGHGAHPEKAKDPIVVAAQMILALQTIVSRQTSALEPVVITVGSIHGGSRRNVIPDEVKLQLSLRAFSDAALGRLKAAIERTARGLALAAGIPPKLAPRVAWSGEQTPSLYNSPPLAKRVVGVLAQIVGPGNVVEKGPLMGSEDFAFYGRADPPIPIFMFRLGSVAPRRVAESRRKGGRPLPTLHSALFAPDPEPTIKTGVKAMSAAVLDLLQV